MEWEYVPYLTCHVMYLLTQNVWPWQDLNLHRSRRDSNPQCLDPSSNALSYATRLLYRLSYTAGRDQALKETAWSWTLQPVSIALPSPCSGGKVANPAWLWDSQFLRYESNWDWGRSSQRRTCKCWKVLWTWCWTICQHLEWGWAVNSSLCLCRAGGEFCSIFNGGRLHYRNESNFCGANLYEDFTMYNHYAAGVVACI